MMLKVVADPNIFVRAHPHSLMATNVERHQATQSKTTFSKLCLLEKLYTIGLGVGTACVKHKRMWDDVEAVRLIPQSQRVYEQDFRTILVGWRSRVMSL